MEPRSRGSDSLDGALVLKFAPGSMDCCDEDGPAYGKYPIHWSTSLELERIHTYRLQQQLTIGSNRSRTPKEQWLPMGAGKPYPPALPESDGYVVEFEGSDDPMHPQNWPMKKRVMIGSLLTFCALVTAYASAVFATASEGVMKEFGFGEEVAALGTTLYVLGFSGGPTVWAPASELIGRRWPLIIGMLGFDLFTIACATAKDTQTLMLTRFFSGFCAASIIALVPASLSDLFNNHHRGIAIAIYTMSVFTGPFTAPFIGGFTAESYLGWRWTLYVPAIVGFFSLALMALFAKETYAPIVLAQKASILRRQTRNWGIHARQDELEIDLKELVTKNLARPFLILFTEPIAFLLTLYMSFIYGLAYALLEAYPIVFQGTYGMTGGVSGLPFIGLIIGEISGSCFVLSLQKSYSRKLIANDDVPIPEWRLPPCIVGGAAFAAGLLWFGWTGWNPSIHWLAPTTAGVLVGFGMTSIFMQGFNYLLDSYLNLYVYFRYVPTTQLNDFKFWVQYAAATYCHDNYVAPDGYKPNCPVGNCPEVEAADSTIKFSFSNDTITDTAGFIAVDNTNKAIILAFRGSYSVRNWITDATFPHTDPGLCKDCKAELGFWTAWTAVRDDILPHLKDLTAAHTDYKLVVVGHSLGAAIASLAAADLRTRNYDATLYAYAAPRVANKPLAQFITDQGKNFRFTHRDDPVPKLPLLTMGYVHTSPEYFITAPDNATITEKDVTVLEGDVNFDGNTGTGLPDVLAFHSHVWYFIHADACKGEGLPLR
ncbi:Alpha/Beta hydrolase protein [Aspergillus avenaceus]|uniref:Alpha/Beta hydrolase protein n=1 Tax=Aspergillus avenaceus TaxID=36643 RepID=A0A5N6U639_ASPAV|nr:Alpha/Beta hydrolase protein [Aspergillus avenaceus]